MSKWLDNERRKGIRPRRRGGPAGWEKPTERREEKTRRKVDTTCICSNTVPYSVPCPVHGFVAKEIK